MAKADSRKAEQWRQYIDAYRTSGLTRRAYCRKHRLNIHQLDYWRKRLTRASVVSNSKNINDFVQLQITAEPPSDSLIKLKIENVTVEIASGFDPIHLKNILRVLGAAC